MKESNLPMKTMFFCSCMIVLCVGFVVLSKHISNEPIERNEIKPTVKAQKDSVKTTCPHCGYKVSIECNESNTTYKNL